MGGSLKVFHVFPKDTECFFCWDIRSQESPICCEYKHGRWESTLKQKKKTFFDGKKKKKRDSTYFHLLEKKDKGRKEGKYFDEGLNESF